MKQIEIVLRSFSKEWIKKVAEKIKQGITEKINFELMEKSNQSFIDYRLDTKTKSTIFIGTFNNTEEAIIGAIAHEIAHFYSPQPNLTSKYYYQSLLKWTSSRRITNKCCEYIGLFNLSTFIDESRVDNFGVNLLRQAGMNPDHMKEMLKCLLKSKDLNIIKKINIRLRLIKLNLC